MVRPRRPVAAKKDGLTQRRKFEEQNLEAARRIVELSRLNPLTYPPDGFDVRWAKKILENQNVH